MPGKEIKGRSKIATYRHGGRVNYATGTSKKLVGGQKKLDKDGSLSSYEKKRGKAIERAMNKMMDGGMVKDERSKFMGGGIAYAGGGKAMKRGKV